MSRDGLDSCIDCGKSGTALFPLLPGSPTYCDAHQREHGLGAYAPNYTGPEEFEYLGVEYEICGFDIDVLQSRTLTVQRFRSEFVWVDKECVEYTLADIDDVYLSNIVNFLDRRIAADLMWDYRDDYMIVVKLLHREQRCRQRESASKVASSPKAGVVGSTPTTPAKISSRVLF